MDVHFGILEPGSLAASASRQELELAATGTSSLTQSTTGRLTIGDAELSLFENLGQSNPASTFSAFIRIPGAVFGVDHPIAGDVNNSGCVDDEDLCIMTQQGAWMYHAVEPNDLAVLADLTRDGWVNVADLNLVLENWGNGCTKPSRSPLPRGKESVPPTGRAFTQGFLCPRGQGISR